MKPRTKRLLKLAIFRVAAVFLVPALVLVGVPSAAAEPGKPRAASAAPPVPPAVTPNRSVPTVRPPALRPVFSTVPTQSEISRARVFEEPLAAEGPTTARENQAFGAALRRYVDGASPEDLRPLEGFLQAHPGSAWRVSLLANLGLVAHRTGYFSKALRYHEQAWRLGKNARAPETRALAERAASEWAWLLMGLGHQETLESLLKELQGRPFSGSSAERLRTARQALWLMQNRPEEAFRCGPVALDRVLQALGRPADDRIAHSPATRRGTSLAGVRDLAHSAGVEMRMAKRMDAQIPLPAPAVVHLKTGHFAAIIEREGERYLVADPVFDQEQWISAAALDAEASGYILALSLPEGFAPVDRTEAETVWGRSCPRGPDPTQQNCPTNGGNCSSGTCPNMAGYTFLSLHAALRIRDTPITYSPPKGPSVNFTLTYNQKEVFQPSVFSYANVGPKWTFDAISYVEDDPSSIGTATQTVRVYLRGGGMEVFQVPAGISNSQPEFRTRAILARVATTPIKYERRSSDGSVETFAQPESGSTFPRKVFMTEEADPQGNKLTYLYGASLQLEAILDALGQVTTFTYGDAASLRVASITDPFGRTAALGYDAQGRLTSITDTLGLTSSFTYGDADFISSLTTPYGTTKFSTGQSASRMWIEAEDPLGARERAEYVIHHDSSIGPRYLPASEIPAGFGTYNGNFDAGLTLYWDKRAMLLAPNDPSRADVTHWLEHPGSHRPRGVIRAHKKPLESRVWYAYANQNSSHGDDARLIKMGRLLDDPDQTGPLLPPTQVTNYTRNVAGMPCSMIDPLGRETRYTYDEADPTIGCTSGSSIDLLTVEQKNGGGWDVVQTSTYNAQHLPLTVKDGANQTTTYTYNSAGQVETVTTPPRAGITEQRTTTYTYQAGTGYLLSVVSPGNVTTSYAYDAYGRMRTMTDNDNDTTTYDYDVFDRPIRTTHPDATYEEIVYDRLDARGFRDRLGRWSETLHDPLRRVVSTRDPANRVVTREWCTCGSLDRLVDPNGNATTWERDIQGRVIKETRADGSFKGYGYEATTSRLRGTGDAKGQQTTYLYDLEDRLVQTVYWLTQHPTPNVTLSYADPDGAPDPHGRLRKMTDGTGDTTYEYRPFGQLGAGQVQKVDGPLGNDEITYGYDELSRVTSRTYQAITSTWNYDQQGRLATQVEPPLGTFVYSYVGNTPRRQSLSYPNGQSTTYSYFGNADDRRLERIDHRGPGAIPWHELTYTYDDSGNIVTSGHGLDGTRPERHHLEYDRADQLNAATLKNFNGAVTLKRYRYAYDPAGNRTAEQIDDVVTGASYDDMNRLLSHQPGGAQLFRGTTNEPARVTVQEKPAATTPTNEFSGTAQVTGGQTDVVVQATDYSPTPNVSTKTYRVAQSGPSRTFSYDPNGNLASRTEGGVTTTYDWDAEDRLIAVKQGTATLASFTYDGPGRRRTKAAGGVTTTYISENDQVLQERSTFFAERRYIRGPGIDQHLAMVEPSGPVTYFAADHLGSVVRTTNGAGATILTRKYDPWGNLLQGAATGGYAFTGREWDSEVGLHYYRARYYDPKVGRFQGEDSSGFGDGPNLYTYVRNNPLSRVDPFGFQAVCWDAMKVTAILSCSVKYVSATGFGNKCAQGAPAKIATLCQDLQDIIKKKKFADMDPCVCPPGQTCADKKPIETWEPVDVEVTFQVPVKKFGVPIGNCNVTVKVTGKFVGNGAIGICKVAGPARGC